MDIRIFRHLLDTTAAEVDRGQGQFHRFSLWRKAGNEVLELAGEVIPTAQFIEDLRGFQDDMARTLGCLPVARVTSAEELVMDVHQAIAESIAGLPIVEDASDTSK